MLWPGLLYGESRTNRFGWHSGEGQEHPATTVLAIDAAAGNLE
jgi:hypothetical protein